MLISNKREVCQRATLVKVGLIDEVPVALKIILTLDVVSKASTLSKRIILFSVS
jgi:hypothetical protein